MAKTIAYCVGIDGSRRKEASRLGSRAAQGRAQTWRTFAICHVNADGSGEVSVKRDDRTIHSFEFGPENEPVTPLGPEAEAEDTGMEESASPAVRRVIGG